MNGKQFLTKTKLGFKKDGNVLLTGLGVLGFAGTIYYCIKDTIDVVKELEEDMNTKEKVLYSIPKYKRTIGLGIGTLSCFVGSTVLSRKNQASLIGAYTLLEQSYKELKDKIKEIHGEEGLQQINDAIRKSRKSNIERHERKEDTTLFYDLYSDTYIETTMEVVKNAECEINRLYSERGYADVNEYYNLLGKPLGIKNGDEFGWSVFDMECNWIYFDYQLSANDDGLECWVIIMETAPEHFLVR